MPYGSYSHGPADDIAHKHVVAAITASEPEQASSAAAHLLCCTLRSASCPHGCSEDRSCSCQPSSRRSYALTRSDPITRHFGGTKLGTGGLARAYGGAARQCLQEAPQCTVSPTALLRMEARCCLPFVPDWLQCSAPRRCSDTRTPSLLAAMHGQKVALRVSNVHCWYNPLHGSHGRAALQPMSASEVGRR